MSVKKEQSKELSELFSQLKKSELSYIKGLADGKHAIEIADEYGINFNTFATKLNHLRLKFNCKTTTELVCFFIRNKIID